MSVLTILITTLGEKRKYSYSRIFLFIRTSSHSLKWQGQNLKSKSDSGSHTINTYVKLPFLKDIVPKSTLSTVSPQIEILSFIQSCYIHLASTPRETRKPSTIELVKGAVSTAPDFTNELFCCSSLILEPKDWDVGTWGESPGLLTSALGGQEWGDLRGSRNKGGQSVVPQKTYSLRMGHFSKCNDIDCTKWNCSDWSVVAAVRVYAFSILCIFFHFQWLLKPLHGIVWKITVRGKNTGKKVGSECLILSSAGCWGSICIGWVDWESKGVTDYCGQLRGGSTLYDCSEIRPGLPGGENTDSV